MFIVSTLPDWVPGSNFHAAYQTVEEAEAHVRNELGEGASEGYEGTYYVREVDLGVQLKYAAQIDIVVNSTSYPEE